MLVLGLLAGSLDARQPQPEAGSLAAAFSRAAAKPPDPTAARTAAKERMTEALDQLDQLLSKASPAQRQQWEDFLRVATIREQLGKQAIDLPSLRKVQERYFLDEPGVELPAVLAVRRALADLLIAAEFSQDQAPQALYRQKLSQLEQCVARLDANFSDEAALSVGALAAWLEPLSPEGKELAAAFRRQYCRPNGIAQVSQHFMNLMLAKAVAEQRFISDVIMGTPTSGVANTHAQVYFGTVPSDRRGTLEVRLEGWVDCPANVAQRRRISIITAAQTSIRASKQVQVSDQGLTLAPATAACATAVQISDVQAGSRFVERLALRRANQLAPEAQEVASRKAEAEASSKLDEQANAALGRMNKMFCEKIRAPLIRRGAIPAQLQFSTDDRHLRLLIAQFNSVQLGAAGEPPALPAEIDLGGCVHETLINNACETLLKGVTIEDQAWRELMNVLTGSSPRQLWVHDRAERWSVVMAGQRPLGVRFADGRIAVTFSFQSVTRGGRTHDSPVKITARFRPQITADGPAFARDGDLQIDIAGSDDDGDDELRQFLARKFGAVLPEELHLSGLVPPAGASLGKLRQLDLTVLSSEGGWLSLGYRLDRGDRIARRP